jgi:hypothetical protein
MPAYNYDIEVHQGETREFELELTDNAGSPIDLTDYSAKMQIRSKPGGEVFLTLTNDSGSGITITPASGTVGVHMTAAQTAGFGFEAGEYDLPVKVDDGGEDVLEYLIDGLVVVTPRKTEF